MIVFTLIVEQTYGTDPENYIKNIKKCIKPFTTKTGSHYDII